MPNLSDKSVGIVGTGATALQIAPEVAKAAKELFVFQRTPSTVGVRGQER
jgi:cation diffusion facilitator CzcD-associated flavoprotein CzcO